MSPKSGRHDGQGKSGPDEGSRQTGARPRPPPLAVYVRLPNKSRGKPRNPPPRRPPPLLPYSPITTTHAPCFPRAAHTSSQPLIKQRLHSLTNSSCSGPGGTRQRAELDRTRQTPPAMDCYCFCYRCSHSHYQPRPPPHHPCRQPPAQPAAGNARRRAAHCYRPPMPAPCR